MSLQLFQDDVVFTQRLLKCAGLYQGDLHGVWTGDTDAAMTTFEADSDAIAAQYGSFDQRTERCIRTLMPPAQRAARDFMRRVTADGIPARIISGSRTYLEQDALYGRGRYGHPGPIVTNARGGYSHHNFGIAWDIGIFEGGKYLGESPLYERAAQVGLAPGLEWGGHWTSFKDRPHYQLALGLGLAATRVNFEAGAAFV
jgi:peptidoglycan L-alanyl-D-glutamate endopeptidase CwlK